MEKKEPFYLIEKLQGENGEAAEWWIGRDERMGEDIFTPYFHEVPEAFKFPTRWHARAIWDAYIKEYGHFKEAGRREYRITEHSIIEHIPVPPTDTTEEP